MNRRRSLNLFVTIGLAAVSLVIVLILLESQSLVAAAAASAPVQSLEKLAAASPLPSSQPSRPFVKDPQGASGTASAPAVVAVCQGCTYTSIQDAVNAVAAGGLVKVAQGIYTDTNGDGWVVTIAKPLTLQGGYTVTNWSTPNPARYATIMDGRAVNQVVYLSNVTATVDGFHIYRGHASNGGGIYVVGGNSTLSRNRIYSSTANSGGGVYIAGGSPFVQNSLVYMNAATRGGGIYIAAGSPTFQNNTLYNNRANDQGGGVYVAAGTSVMSATIVANNTASSSGGGIYAAGSLVPGYNDVWGNAGGDYVGVIHPTDISADPFFVSVNPLEVNFLYPQAASPCINQVPTIQAASLDYKGLLRPFGDKADIGAYEFYTGTCFARVDGGNIYASVQQAVDAAGAGDTIQVAGICQGVSMRKGFTQTVYISKSVTLQGGYTVTQWTNPNPDAFATILDAQGLGRVVYVTGTVQTVIEGFHIRNGYISGTASIVGGGGLYIAGGAHKIQGNKIYNNTARSSTPGWPRGGGLYIASGNSVIQDNAIYSNHLLGAAPSGQENDSLAGGGGLYATNGVLVTTNSIYSNTSTVSGGGLFVYGATVRGNLIYSNTASNYGGGLCVRGSGTTVNVVEDNGQIRNNSAGRGGGGIGALKGTFVTIRRNTLYANSTGGDGGGIYFASANDAILPVDNPSNGTVERNDIHGNSAGTGYGGGVRIGDGTVQPKNNLIYGNGAQNGGGIAVYILDGAFRDGSPILLNNTIYNNTASTWGGGIYNRQGTDKIKTTIISNTILVNNTAGNQGGGIYTIYSSSPWYPRLGYNDIWNNTGGNYSGVTPPATDISINPQLVNPAGADFHLQSGSPCIDAADPSHYPADDYAGNARPFGLRTDMGAYEYYTGNCFAQIAPATQVYTNVQQAVNLAAAGSLVKVAGTCQGVSTVNGVLQTVYISKALTLQGGFVTSNWVTPTSIATLNALKAGRAVYVTGTGPATIDGFVLRGGQAITGGGLYLASAITATLQNIMFYSNTATNGGGFASVGGNLRLYNNTFAANNASSNGGGLYLTSGSPIMSNTIVVSNSAANGGGVYAKAGAIPILTYNDVWHNAGGNYAGVFTATNSVSIDPLFVNFAAGDLHLQIGSRCVNAGAPNTGLRLDIEGDPRPLPPGTRWYDIGADESTNYPGVSFAPDIQGIGAPGRDTLYEHTLTNTGRLTDTFVLTHSLATGGIGTGWDIGYAPVFTLGPGQAVVVPVSIHAPVDTISGSYAISVITATSQLNPAMSDAVTDLTIVKRAWGVEIAPPRSGPANPGTVITYVHTLTNIGNFTDTFNLTWESNRDWASATPTQVVVGVYQTVTLLVHINVPATAPGGLTDTTILTASRAGPGPAVRATVTDTTNVNHVPGDRYVAITGQNTNPPNNCQVAASPCRTISYAVRQAANRDTIKVAAGAYNEYDIVLNENITLTGGYNDRFSVFDPLTNKTIVNAQKLGRVFYILGSPIVEGFTLKNGSTAGSGGGIYIADGSPIIRQNTITNNIAGVYGGGIYNGGTGAPVLERNKLAFNTAQWGGGFATYHGVPDFWDNLIYANTAGAGGGGIYVMQGAPRLWHNTLYGNTADRGGGIYLAGGSPGISNTIVVSNNARITSGGIYGGGGAPHVDYTDVWANDSNVPTGTHSFSSDPLLFTNQAYTSFLHLRAGSPCINTGDFTQVALDFDGQPRTADFRPDIGADEIWRGGVKLEPNNAGIGYQGTPVTYRHILTNTGNAVDTFVLTWRNQHGWKVSVNGATTPTVKVTLGVGLTKTVTVQVIRIPTATLSGTVDVTVITATSKYDSKVFDTAVDTTTVAFRYVGVSLVPDRNYVDQPWHVVWFTHTLTNLGNYTDTFLVEPLGGWLSLVSPAQGQVILGPGLATTVIVTAVVPYYKCGDQRSGMLTAKSKFSLERGDNPIVSDAVTDTVTVDQIDGVSFTGSTQRVVSDPSITRVVHYANQLWNINNCYTDTFDLSIPSSTPFAATLISPPQVTLGPRGTTSVLVDVFVPPSPPACYNLQIGNTTVRADGTLDSAEAQDQTIVNQCLDVELKPDRTAVITQPSTSDVMVIYTHTLTNQGNYADTFALTAIDGLNWAKKINGISYDPLKPRLISVMLPSGQSDEVTFAILAPSAVASITNPAFVTAESMTWGQFVSVTRTDTVTDTTIVRRPGVKIAPNYTSTVASGQVITFVHIVTNIGAVVDTYDLTGANSLPGWTIGINPPVVSSLQPGLSATVQVTIGAPLTAISSTIDTAVITATSRITQAIFDTAVDKLTVPYVPGAMIAPDYAEWGDPGKVITYIHALTNTGNWTETYELTTHSQFGYSELKSDKIVQLRPRQVYTPVIVTMLLPDHTAPGEVEHTEVIVTFAHQQAVAIDLTTANPISGTRYVAPDGTDVNNNCTVPAGIGPCATVQQAVNCAAPEDEVRVAQGVYTDVHVIGGSAQVVYLDKSHTLLGGYTIYDWNTPNPVAHPTVLDARGQGRVIYVASGPASTIEGFHLRGGFASGDGAGLYIANGVLPTVRANVIYNNAASNGSGGGVYWGTSGGMLHRNTIYSNTARYGAGAYIAVGSPQIWNNVLYHNNAIALGGGLYSGGSPSIWNDTFYNNGAGANGGGGIYIATGEPAISQTIVADNANYGIYASSGSPALDYNDIWHNDSSVLTGTHSISQDPRFVNAAGGNLHVTGASPCVDAGDPTAAWPLDDRDGNLRPLLDGYDIGAYEYGLMTAKRAPAMAAPGSIVTYTLVVTNSGAADWSGAIVTDTLHPYLSYAGALAYTTGAARYITATRTISWTGPVYGHSATRITFTAQITGWLAAGVPITNAAWLYTTADAVTTVVEAIPGARHVSQEAESTDALNNCLMSWKPCRTVQYGVNQALESDAVQVASGTYTDALGAGQVVAIAGKGVQLVGGYAPGTWAYNPETYVTTLDGQGVRRGAIITGPASVTLAGFQIKNSSGNGVHASAATTVVSRTRIYSNTQNGVYATGGNLAVKRAWVYANGGDGVAVNNGAYTLINNVLAHNVGAGLQASNSSGVLKHNTFARNDGTSAIIGGAAGFTNTIFYSETVGLDVPPGSQANLWNTLWYSITAPSVGGGAVVSYTNLYGDPLFFNPNALNYHIRLNSPATDHGLDVGVHEDIDGDMRPLLGAPDIGADEFALDIHKDAPPSAGPSQVITYVVTMKGDDISNIILTDTLPSYLVCSAGTLTFTRGSGQYNHATCTITWNGPISATVPTHITFTARITDWLAAGTQVVNIATLQLGLDVYHTTPAVTTISAMPGTRLVSQGMASTDALNNCLMSWKPCRTVQYGVNQALESDAVQVASGIYTDALGAGQVVAIAGKGVQLVGGYAPGTWAYNPETYVTTLDGQGVRRGVIITGPASVTLAGFQIKNSSGNGVHASAATTVVSRTRIYSNTQNGVYATGGNLAVKRAWVYANGGDGVAVNNGAYALTNNIIAQNTGVGLRAGSTGSLKHNTFARNSAAGAIISGTAAFTNTIFYSHTAGITALPGGSVTADHTLWYATTPYPGATNNIIGNPKFVNPAGFNYHIGGDSAALNKGAWITVTDDIDGDSRSAGQVDIGADQYTLRFSRQIAPLAAPPCGVVTHTLKLTNIGGGSLTGVRLSDALGAKSAFGGYAVATTGSVKYITASNTISWTGGVNLATPTLITYTSRANAYLSNGTAITYSAIITDAISRFGTPPITVTVATLPAIARKYAPATATIGQVITYTIVYSVPAGHAAYQTQVVDQLPRVGGTPVMTVSMKPSGFTVSADGGTITGTLPTVFAPCGAPVAGSVAFSAQVRNLAANTRGSLLTNHVTISYNEMPPNSLARTITATHTASVVEPAANIVKSMTPNTNLGALDLVNVTLKAGNTGNSPLYDVRVTDTLPSKLSFVAATPGYARNGQMVTWAIASLTPSTRTFTITAQVSEEVGPQATLTNTAQVYGTSQSGFVKAERSYAGTGQATATTGYPDLSITKLGSLAISPGQTITYAIHYINIGLVRAEGVRITDTLPPLITNIVSATSAAATVAHVGQDVVWTLSAPVSRSISGTIWITGTTSGSAEIGTLLTNTVHIGAITSEPNKANNSALARTSIGIPAVSVAPLVFNLVLTPNSTATRTLTIANLGQGMLLWGPLAESPAASWLSASPTSGYVPIGGAASQVILTFDSSGLGGNLYSTILQVPNNDPDNSMVSVTVTLVVTTSCTPVSGATFTYSPVAPVPGQTVTFTGAVNPASTGPINYTWNFGDGSIGNGPVVQHTYTDAGAYPVAMTAANCGASQDLAQQVVTINPHRIYLPIVLKKS